MEDQFIRYMYQDGINAAARTYELPFRIHARCINTYFYRAAHPVMAPPEEMDARGERAQEKLGMVMGRLNEVWNREFLPEIQRHLADWEEFDLRDALMDSLLAELDATVTRIKRLWEIHYEIAFPFLLALSLFEELYRDLFSKDATLEAYRLLQGFDNKTLEADRALWGVARKAVVSPEVKSVLEHHAAADVMAALEGSPAGQAFLAELSAYLNEYGRRGEAFFDLSTPGWIEDLTPVIKTLKDYMTRPDHDPMAEMESLAAEREQLSARSRERLKEYPEPVTGQFEVLLKAAQESAVLREEHTFWIDFAGTYHTRRMLLEIGRRFAEARVIEEPEDVLYLKLDEVEVTASAAPWIDRRRVVAGRRAEQEFFRTVVPPPLLGTMPSGPLPDDPLSRALGKMFGGAPQPPTAGGVLRGISGSSGRVHGPARVIRSLGEAGKLQRGDVLVCETTTPPWTPLFATAVAVVTDVGGVLSHCAVVAREYQIPAVVGTDRATTIIRDGQILEVDGDAGVVRTESPP
jgi:pyruvate,water dikinase